MIKLILLGIVKGIGILLSVVLLILLLALFLVLLSPLKYRVEGEKGAELCGSFGVSWLLGAIRAEGGYAPDTGGRLKLRVLWFTPVGGAEKPKKEKKKKNRKKTEPIPLQAAEKQTEAPQAEQKQTAPPQKEEKEKPQCTVKPQCMAEKQPKIVRRVKVSEIPEELPVPEKIEDEGFFTGDEGEEKAEKEGKIPPILKELWSIEDKREILKAFAQLLRRLLRDILPGNFFLRATVGTGDPPTTGYLLGLAGILTAKFGNDIQIKGDFTKATLEDVAVRIKGKIVFGKLLWAVLAFALKKPVRRAIRKEIGYFKGEAADAKGETA